MTYIDLAESDMGVPSVRYRTKEWVRDDMTRQIGPDCRVSMLMTLK